MIAGALVLRMLGVFVCLLGTNLNTKERAFSMMAYTPKATVQAAIGGIPLSLGLGCGDMVLTVAVLAIVLTAPLGCVCEIKLFRVIGELEKEGVVGQIPRLLKHEQRH